ncbi:hypothetical protein CSA80_03135 [Candidatus Saccharibacteria bacterium]|nr:MAG: hypothetical protein CR973_00290 [Candidatus Saccharibacteria bacterium]PID99083.1 MAG: hypothetical protein CSA80_03135 [Candidatus Saccharibacteria bacterium]
MQLKRYQWVGLLAGVPLFSGAWLSAFYNNAWWGVFGIVITVGGLSAITRFERRADNATQAKRGLAAGALAAVVARVLGAVAAGWAGVSETVSLGGLDDTFRVVLAGDFWATALLVAVTALVGAAAATAEQDAKGGK